MPFMVLLMVLEGLVNTFHRRKEHNLADSITRWRPVMVLMLMMTLMLTLRVVVMVVTVVSSISFGLLMTLAGLATRVLMVEVYYRVHRDYSLVMYTLH